ncbi:hypothetical protein C8R47DRAFT_1218990 [Mycena vitilis]|nr:hypothetical protein C8R47DRAFT_1218990 [Mycena vitilis]
MSTGIPGDATVSAGPALGLAIPPAASRLSREALHAALARVDNLLQKAQAVTALAEELRDILENVVPESDSIFFRDPHPKTPAQVAAEYADEADGTRPWWVVYVGREPGVYTTSEAADAQTKGCPGQQQRRRESKSEALALYARHYDEDQVRKWVEVEDEDE